MIDPFTIGALVYAGTVAVAAIIVTVAELYNWFRNRSAIKKSNQNIVAFTLAQRINGKNYVEVPGVFDGSTHATQMIQGFYDAKRNELVAGRIIKTDKQADVGVQEFHDRGNGIVTYA